MRRCTALLVIALTLIFSAAAMACPLCKDSVPNNDGQSAAMVPGALNNSVYMMLVGFFAVLGMVSWTLIKGARGNQTSNRRGFPIDRK